MKIESRASLEVTGDSTIRVEPSFATDLRVERGSLRDYALLAPMHYRQRDRVGFVDKVYALRSRDGGTFGVAVYGHSALELRPRNRATAGRFVKNAELLNEEVRVLKRLIVHPDVRGCGLGQRLVRESLPRVGVRFVECLAAMGLVNPIFEKAGMLRIGVCELPREQERIVRELKQLGADVLAAGFESTVCERPEVRQLVAGAVLDWYRSITGAGRRRVARQSARTLARTYRQIVGSRPVYYIWARDGKDRRQIERNLAE